VKDLSSFLAGVEADTAWIKRPIPVRYEVTALQHKLGLESRDPVLLIEQPRLANGSLSAFRAVTNLNASRARVAEALGLDDHRRAARDLAVRVAARIEPVRVTRDEAPVKQVATRGPGLSLEGLPVFTQHDCDPGPYLTAAHATTYDPDTGVDNTAIQRLWAKPGNELPFYPYPASHNRANVMKFWARGEDAPIAFWIGHHPAVSIGAQAKLDYPESHWATAGALAGEPVRLVPTELFGNSLLVPADAEIVLEGRVLRNRLEPEGPFGEYTGYAGDATLSPVFALQCITHRRNAIYHDIASGLRDALVPDDMLNEARLLAIAQGVTGAVRNVHVPSVSRRFLAIVQTGEINAATAHEVLRRTLEYRRVKTVVLVGEDIDPFNRDQVEWAMATRVQWDRDTVLLRGMAGSLLDPSLPKGSSDTAKMGIDATWNGGRKPPRNRVPEDVWRRLSVADYLP
jgi:2,5-furandicarboxylate decarboxylase 1